MNGHSVIDDLYNYALDKYGDSLNSQDFLKQRK